MNGIAKRDTAGVDFNIFFNFRVGCFVVYIEKLGPHKSQEWIKERYHTIQNNDSQHNDTNHKSKIDDT